ncbi:MAG TPA: L-serine ammonia-lyase, iron-sulfur-dependent, subunit alpha [Acidobacteriota bacterium]|nr:L-serine ammonia-lyase, iron-sulfur-dependent, subunit alpha [Acidobacteriota bacterium]HQF86995.1 L-serine ammonia-lyase, iron-sulfur-dependent, subunit alpha [Acidobacteriota bacterium]HQG91556.1 L-serine ammonia-lyase, iron-sulfur-dependent, subunit alpha [Acidobacteriota bacterium]HQK88703.1 L-serine ammonia-lyase, iron-sulfur-dependent, subunit alpha [Acidobacteriota bacterium]
MPAVSILNDVLGPVMRGPSSSHTAGSHRIGRLATALLGEPVRRARVAFDPGGSYSQVYREQGVDLALAAALLGWELTAERFDDALAAAQAEGIDLAFTVEPLVEADHPNTIDIVLEGVAGSLLSARARSTGGGSISLDRLGGWPVALDGTAGELLVEAEAVGIEGLIDILSRLPGRREPLHRQQAGSLCLLHVRLDDPPSDAATARLQIVQGVRRIWSTPPLYPVIRGEPMFRSAADLCRLADEHGLSVGRLALASEAQLLGWSEAKTQAEMSARLEVMRAAVRDGLARDTHPMRLLESSAGAVYRADAAGRLFTGGLPARAAARALAAMHVTSGGGVVCAAPTGGSAGVLPAVAVTLAEELGQSDDAVVQALFAAGAVGAILAERATFAAEVAGCQVEIGAAGAMAAAAVVAAAGGSARQVADAAAIAFQNTMGSVCDLVQGMVEIPCHTRNAAAAASAFVMADLVLGGYANPVPLDETIDAVYATGRMLPPELRCTARGGLAATPSARSLRRRR